MRKTSERSVAFSHPFSVFGIISQGFPGVESLCETPRRDRAVAGRLFPARADALHTRHRSDSGEELPVLSQRFSADTQLDLSSRASALKGGQKSGPAMIPGDAARSPLYRRLTGQDQPAMPLGSRLSEAEIGII